MAYADSAAFNVRNSIQSVRDSKYNSSPNLANACIVLPKTKILYVIIRRVLNNTLDLMRNFTFYIRAWHVTFHIVTFYYGFIFF